MDKLPAMLKHFVVPELLLAGLMFSPVARAQSPAPKPDSPKNRETAPAAASVDYDGWVGSSRVDLQACKLEYSIVSPK